jgi:hypothetical protein
MMRSTRAASETVRAKTEMQSSARQARTTPVVDTRPTVGFMPTQPQKCAGTRPDTNDIFILTLLQTIVRSTIEGL